MVSGGVTRIGFFIDGGYWREIETYHHHYPGRRGPRGLQGLLDFVASDLARWEGADASRYSICERHYFGGRLSDRKLERHGQRGRQTGQDQVLERLGFTSHYHPIRNGKEEGVDVRLTTKALGAVNQGRIDLVALVAGDGDFVPLVEALKEAGARVVIVAASFHYAGADGRDHLTATSRRLTREADHVVWVAGGGDAPSQPPPHSGSAAAAAPAALALADAVAGLGGKGRRRGRVWSWGRQYCFIKDDVLEDMTWYCCRHNTDPGIYDRLQVGQRVEFALGRNYRGPTAVDVRPVDGQSHGSTDTEDIAA